MGLLLAALIFATGDDIVVPPLYDIRFPGCTHTECAQENPERPYCADADEDRCVECIEHVHCEAGMICLDFGVCSSTCESDEECLDPFLPRCDAFAGRCVECIEQSDCDPTTECNVEGRCTRIFTCIPGTVTCSGESVVECSSGGDTVTELERCPYDCAGGSCVEDPDPDPVESDPETVDRGCACAADTQPGVFAWLPLLVLGLRRRYQL